MPRVIDYSDQKAGTAFTSVSFHDFYSVYAVLQKFDHIPQIHVDIIDFLEGDNQWNGNNAVLQCFRNAAKSSIAAAWVVWKLVVDPSLIILVQSADNTTAQKMIDDCKKIIVNHPMARHLYYANAKWTANGIKIAGATSGRNMSISARGIFSNVTGSRADIIVYDDVEVPKNAGNSEQRDKLRDRIAESGHLLNPHGKRLFIGTPHSWESIYPEIIEAGASSLRIPLLKSVQGEFPYFTGDSNWPERWDSQHVANKQLMCKGKGEFLSQYQLLPVSPEDSILDTAKLKTYEQELEFRQANGSKSCWLGDLRVKKLIAFWDPALSKATGDASVLTIAFDDEKGNVYLHRVEALIGEVEEQCKQVRKLLVDHHVSSVFIESNGIGATFPQYLSKHVRGLGIGVCSKHTSVRKSESIVTAFETPLSAGAIYIHKSVHSGKFIQQMTDFRPGGHRHDDYLDSAAKAIHCLPVFIGRGMTNSIPGFEPHRYMPQVTEVEVSSPFD